MSWEGTAADHFLILLGFDRGSEKCAQRDDSPISQSHADQHDSHSNKENSRRLAPWKDELLNVVENGSRKNANRNGDEVEVPGASIKDSFSFTASIVSEDEADFKGNPDCWYQDKQDDVDGHTVFFLKGNYCWGAFFNELAARSTCRVHLPPV